MIKQVRKGRTKTLNVMVYVMLSLGAIIMLIPFLWMVSTSIKTADATFVLPPQWIPENPTSLNYVDLFSKYPVSKYFFNSITVTIASTLGQIILCSMSAYAFARFKFKGRDVIFLIYLATMMIPTQAILIPQYVIMNKLGWINSYKGLIIPGMFSAFGTFLMRQYFLKIPKELEEAAYLDGAGIFRIFFQIMLPLCKPGLAVLSVSAFMESWNSFLWPLLVVSDSEHTTLPLFLSMLQGRWYVNWNILMAATLFTIIPILVVYLFAQKYFVEGVMNTGVKG